MRAAPIPASVRALLPLCGAENDHEALGACRGIGRKLQAAGLDWHTLAAAIPAGEGHDNVTPLDRSGLSLRRDNYGCASRIRPMDAFAWKRGNKPRQEAPKKRKQPSAEELARMQQRMSMNPNEVKRDQQLEILEARAGGGTANTSFGRSSGPSRQMEKGSGGFTVRKFKDKRGTAQQKRGVSRKAGGIDPKGKPLTHKTKKRFLFF